MQRMCPLCAPGAGKGLRALFHRLDALQGTSRRKEPPLESTSDRLRELVAKDLLESAQAQTDARGLAAALKHQSRAELNVLELGELGTLLTLPFKATATYGVAVGKRELRTFGGFAARREGAAERIANRGILLVSTNGLPGTNTARERAVLCFHALCSC